jgi:hypothetical protein
MMRTIYPARFIALACALMAMGLQAQELEPRTYSNVPTDLNFLLAGYVYSQGGLAPDPAVPLENADIKIHTAVLAYARSLDVWGKSGQFAVVLPYSSFSGTAEISGQPVSREVTGPGDPRFRFSVNFLGAPAMSLPEFAHYQQDLIVGASLTVWAPFGQYDPSKLVNIGSNRWTVTPEFGASKAWGPWTLEAAAGITWFSDNNDYFGGQTLEQEPLYSAQLHLLYQFRSGIWAAISGNRYTGGRTAVDGVAGDDFQENSRLGATMAFPVDRHNSIKVNVSRGVTVRTGTNFDIVGVVWQHRWGAGF